jgi:hypothetical protein
LLEVLVARTNEHQGPHRPQVSTLKPITVAPNELPAFIAAHDCTVGFVYGEDVACPLPTKDALLWIRFHPAPGRGGADNGLYHGEIVVDVWQDAAYPLSEMEVEWVIADYCSCTGHAWRQLPVGWEKLYTICVEDELGAGQAATPPSACPPDAGAPQPARRKRKARPLQRHGQPRTEAARWLQGEIANLPDPYAFQHLYPVWLRIHWQKTGDPPRNSYNSFKQMAEACVDRILAGRSLA